MFGKLTDTPGSGAAKAAAHRGIADTKKPLPTERLREKPFDRPDFARRSFPFHRTLFDAIANGDPEAARTETLKILAIVEEDIKEMSK